MSPVFQAENILVHGLRALIVALVLVAWQVFPPSILDETLLSRPSDIAVQTIAWLRDGTLATQALATLIVVAGGLFWGGLIGIFLGLAAGRSSLLGEILDAPLNLVFAMPKVALVPLFIVWFGVDSLQHMVYTAVVVFFFFFYATFNGVRQVPRHLRDMMAIAGASSWQTLWKLYFPACFGWILAGLKIAVPYAFVSAISAEIIASRDGLGNLVKTSASTFDAAGTFSSMLVLLVLSVFCSALAHLLGARSHWNIEEHR